jgi:hypothetical protein
MIPREPRNAAEACDILAIAHLAAAYADAVSRGDIAEACQTYAEDGELRSPTTEPAIGRRAVIETITATTSGLKFVFQCVHQGLVQVDGDGARAISDHRMGAPRRGCTSDTVPGYLRGRVQTDTRGVAFFSTHVEAQDHRQTGGAHRPTRSVGCTDSVGVTLERTVRNLAAMGES